MAVLVLAHHLVPSTPICSRSTSVKKPNVQLKAVATQALSPVEELQRRTSILDSTDAELDTLSQLDDSVLQQLEDLYLAADAMEVTISAAVGLI